MWFSATVLSFLETLPNSPQGINKKARIENWERRKVVGKKGVSFEYSFKSLPQETQAELILKSSKKSAVENLDRSEIPAPQRKQLNYLPEAFWIAYDKATQKKKEKAEHRFKAVCAVTDLVANGTDTITALVKAGERFGESWKTIKRWYYRVKPFERSDWLAVLVSKHDGKHPELLAEFSDEAWSFFKADYLRPERPQFNACYRRLLDAARENNWTVPSISAVKSKLEREVPKIQQIYWRKGEHAVSQLYPSQQRTVADLEAMEWINGDGYQHNVFVRWHNGEIVRPKTWYWQDIRTRKILGYRADLSENSDTIRLSLMDVVWKYGIPKHLTIDNTRAAANKWMTGGVKNRYRFKVKEDDVKGIIPTLGIDLHWTSVQFGKGHGQAKPIERAFGNGGLGEIIDKHPNFAGFYAGSSVDDQPDNYNGGKDGVDYDTFILILEEGIQHYNAQMGRKTEICQGVYSFDQVFERDYALATKVRKASAEQLL
ncbi:transposase domain-containing protein [Aggregatibacter actinomycetemcomitans]|uniref:transposase domain-containing protein n=1 Tax=Aggregatibacter actinomycetemcomitans TaxID=714 RepID=UPI0021CBA54B